MGELDMKHVLNKQISRVGLIAGISGEVLTEKLHEHNIYVALVGGKTGESGMNIANAVMVADLSCVDEIDEFFKNQEIECIILGTGHKVAIELAKKLSERGYIFPNNINSCILAKDKIRYKYFLLENNLPTPIFLTTYAVSKDFIEEVINNIGLPCVIKSATDAILPQCAKNKEELYNGLLAVQETGTEILVEKYIDGCDTTIPVVADGEVCKALFVSYYSKARECALKGFSVSMKQEKKLGAEKEQEILSLAEETIQKTGLTGLVRVDAMTDNNSNIYVLEANSVMVTGVHPKQMEYGLQFLKKEGVDFAEILVDTSLKILQKKIKR